MDYDLVKCQTLLFFYEIIILKGKPEKFHDLMSRCGDKRFTKEMRSIVGRNAAGLKKLLSEHPSLFTIINDELVDVTTYESGSNVSSVGIRDYTQETKDYLKDKLLGYGIGNPIPIVCLHGHLSQAPDQIRHMSGPRVKQLTHFLSKHSDTFQIIGDDLNDGPQQSIDRKETQKTLYCDQVQQSGHRELAVAVTTSVAVNEFDCFDLRLKSQLDNLYEYNCPKFHEASNLNAFHGAVENLTIDRTNMPSSFNYFTDGNWKENVLKHSIVITTVDDSLLVTNELMHPDAVVSLICEGFGSNENRRITLLGLGTTFGQAFLFDVLICPEIMTDGGMNAVLESDTVIKVMHDCRLKSFYLYKQFQINLKNVFDTQSVNAILQYQRNGTPVNLTKNLSFYQLIKLYYSHENLLLEDLFPHLTAPWNRRPLPLEMCISAARDVLLLIDEKLYGSMAVSIKPENKLLLSNLCTEQILAMICPNEVKEQKKCRKYSYKTADLKQKIAQSPNKIVLSNREIETLRYVNLTSDENEKLLGTQNLAKNLELFENSRKDRLNRQARDEFLSTKSTDTHADVNRSGKIISPAATSSENQEFSLPCDANETVKDGEVSSAKHCCKCYVEKECQTLGTGDIITMERRNFFK